jgi:hypothetical protein
MDSGKAEGSDRPKTTMLRSHTSSKLIETVGPGAADLNEIRHDTSALGLPWLRSEVTFKKLLVFCL